MNSIDTPATEINDALGVQLLDPTVYSDSSEQHLLEDHVHSIVLSAQYDEDDDVRGRVRGSLVELIRRAQAMLDTLNTCPTSDIIFEVTRDAE